MKYAFPALVECKSNWKIERTAYKVAS